MKKILIGFLVGSMISLTTLAYADGETFTAIKAGFKVLVNGEELKTDKPIVVIDGSTYLPLRAIGDSLNTKIVWNNDLKQVEVGEPTPVITNQFSFDSPGDVGISQTILIDDKENTRKFSITLKDILRGENAELFVKNNPRYKDYEIQKPQEGYEYLLLKINFNILLKNKNKPYNINSWSFSLISSDGKKYNSNFVRLLPDDLELDKTVYATGENEGWISMLVRKDDKKPRLNADSIWFKAYKD